MNDKFGTSASLRKGSAYRYGMLENAVVPNVWMTVIFQKF